MASSSAGFFPAQTPVNFINIGAGTVTVSIISGSSTFYGCSASTTSFTIPQYGNAYMQANQDGAPNNFVVNGSSCAVTAAGAVTKISTQTANNTAATLAFTALPNYPVIELECSNIILANNNIDLVFQIGEGAGPTYQTTGYYSVLDYTTNSTGPARVYNMNVNGIVLNAGADINNTNANYNFDSSIKIYNIAATGNTKKIVFGPNTYDGPTIIAVAHGGGGDYNDGVAITGVRISTSASGVSPSGNIVSGSCTAYGKTG